MLLFAGYRIRLRITLDDGRIVRLGVSPKVDLNALAEWFGKKFSVRDCRRDMNERRKEADNLAD